MAYFFNPFYLVANHYANKHRRAFFISYAALAAFIVGIAGIVMHANRYLNDPAHVCSTDTDTQPNTHTPDTTKLHALNCYLAGITGSVINELMLLYLVAISWVLPHASHMLSWMAFWAVLSNVWPVMRDVTMVVWGYRWHFGAAIGWGVVLAASRFGSYFGSSVLELLATEMGALNGTFAGSSNGTEGIAGGGSARVELR